MTGSFELNGGDDLWQKMNAEQKRAEHTRLVGNDIVLVENAGKLLGMDEETWKRIYETGYFESFSHLRTPIDTSGKFLYVRIQELKNYAIEHGITLKV
jgi:hypothetical protein